MSLGKFGSRLALRHASWRTISQGRPDHDGDANDESNAYSTTQLAAPQVPLAPVGYMTFTICGARTV
jgi:hypothetical protein